MASMFWKARTALLACWLISSLSFGLCEDSDNTIFRDIAIIGGGASGTYSAIKLRDEGKSVILIEKEDVLGGHTNTYRDPLTNTSVDYGVLVFHDQTVVKDYFKRLNVSWVITRPEFGASTPNYLDPKTAKSLQYTSPDPTSALVAYATELSRYPKLEQGFFLPDPVPEDLLLPFGKFIEKYPDIANATYLAFNYGQGLGDYLKQPTLYVFKNFGLDIIQDIASGFLIPTSGNNYEIYARATKILGSDVLLKSVVVDTPRRDDDGVQLIIRTPNGNRKVNANKLLVTIPPKLENLDKFALDRHETELFGKFMNTGYYTCLVNNTGLPQNFTSYSVSADTQLNIPNLPGVYNIVPTAIQGVFDVKYGSPSTLPDLYVKSEIVSYIRQLQAGGLAERILGEPNFVAFKSHAPFELTVSTDHIANGFYEELYELQGYRNTWYTGAAFHTQDSAMLWNFTYSYVLPRLLD
ncbi:FAD/NAD(P)-binding domain-containing protein [Penicillium herquei]|nr:FAD/NAD(P)-binding domain-containing protein [Penicillium herquei]